MYFLITVKVALKSLLANKLRSFLAVLGIIIGVGAVIAMLAIGAGAQKQIVDRIQAMGTDLLMIRPGLRGTGGVVSGQRVNLKVPDCDAILSEVPEVLAVAPVVNGRAQAKYFEKNESTTVLGTSDSYLSIRNFEIAKGRGFSSGESEQLARVCLIGATVVENLFGEEEPVGATLKVNGINFLVVGVLKAKGDQGWFNPDDQIIVPYLTGMQQVIGTDHLNEIDVQGKPGKDHSTHTKTTRPSRNQRGDEDIGHAADGGRDADVKTRVAGIGEPDREEGEHQIEAHPDESNRQNCSNDNFQSLDAACVHDEDQSASMIKGESIPTRLFSSREPLFDPSTPCLSTSTLTNL